MEDAELHDASNKRGWKQYAVVKQKEKGKKPSRKVIKAQWLK